MPIATWIKQPSNLAKIGIGVLGTGVGGGWLAWEAAQDVTESLGAMVALNKTTTWFSVSDAQPVSAWPSVVPEGVTELPVTLGGPWPNTTKGNGANLVIPRVWQTGSMDTVYAVASPPTGNATEVVVTAIYDERNTSEYAKLLKFEGNHSALNIPLPIVDTICAQLGEGNMGLVVSVFPDTQINNQTFFCSNSFMPPNATYWDDATQAIYNGTDARVYLNYPAFTHAYIGSSVNTSLYAIDDKGQYYPINVTAEGQPYFAMTASDQNAFIDPSPYKVFAVGKNGYPDTKVPLTWHAPTHPIALIRDDGLANKQDARVTAVETAFGATAVYALLAWLMVRISHFREDELSQFKEATHHKYNSFIFSANIITFIVPLLVYACQLPAMPSTVSEDTVMALADTSTSFPAKDYQPGFQGGAVKLTGFYPQMGGVLVSLLGLAIQVKPPKWLAKIKDAQETMPRELFDALANDLPVACTLVSMVVYCIQLGGSGFVMLLPLAIQFAAGVYSKRQLRGMPLQSELGEQMVNSAERSDEEDDATAAEHADPEQQDSEAPHTPPPRASVSLTDGKTPKTLAEHQAILAAMASSPAFLKEVGGSDDDDDDDSDKDEGNRCCCVM